jgi:hypothetical protein
VTSVQFSISVWGWVRASIFWSYSDLLVVRHDKKGGKIAMRTCKRIALQIMQTHITINTCWFVICNCISKGCEVWDSNIIDRKGYFESLAMGERPWVCDFTLLGY